MHPIIFHFGILTVYSYGVMLGAAVVVCALLLSYDAKKQGISRDVVYDFVFWVVLAGITGARIFYIFLNWDSFMQNPKEIFMIQHGGLAWQGGLISGAAAAWIFIKKNHLPLLKFLDLASPYAALGQSIGRIGCLLNGCCYGRPAAWGLFFPAYEARLHPTQIYETIGLLFVFLILRRAQKVNPHPGRIFVLYLYLAALERFIVEFFRADHEATWLMGLSIFQIVCVFIFAAGIAMHWYVKNHRSSN